VACIKSKDKNCSGTGAQILLILFLFLKKIALTNLLAHPTIVQEIGAKHLALSYSKKDTHRFLVFDIVWLLI